MNRPLTTAELREIALTLDDYHKVFYTFWDLASVSFSDQIPTAAVSVRSARPAIMLNEEFWKSLNEESKQFVIIHECLHVILDHGFRNADKIKSATPALANIAQDITINHIIVDLFGFDRNKLQNWENACWIDTVFKDNPKYFQIKKHQSFYYYLDLLIEQLARNPQKKLPNLIDDHSAEGGSGTPGSAGDDSEESSESTGSLADSSAAEIDALAKKLANQLTKKELKEMGESVDKPAIGFPGGTSAGTGRGLLNDILDLKNRVKKIKFEKILDGIKGSREKEDMIDIDTFKFKSRRYASLMKHNENIKLPGIEERARPSKSKLNIAMFMDVSASCIKFIPSFKKMASAFLLEKSLFDVNLHVFDNRVTPVKIDGYFPTGGGTNFGIIEKRCLEIEAETGRYPDAVLVVTDGFGTDVRPKHNNRWVIILTEGMCMANFAKNTRHFAIKDVTFNELAI